MDRVYIGLYYTQPNYRFTEFSLLFYDVSYTHYFALHGLFPKVSFLLYYF